MVRIILKTLKDPTIGQMGKLEKNHAICYRLITMRMNTYL